MVEAAKRVGLYNEDSLWIWRNGMRREFVKEFQGDSRKDTFYLYNLIDFKELKDI